MSNYKDIESIINWKPYTGSNKPSTGVLCKWKDGRVEPFDPRVHTVKDLLFVESDTPKRNEV